MGEIIFMDEAFAIIGARFAVHNGMGFGFVEQVYQECLEIEFGLRNIPFIPKAPLSLTNKGRTLIKTFEPDFVCFDKIIVEIKAVSELVNDHRAQVHNYLKATDFRLGLLVNFGSKNELEYNRIAN